MKPLTLSHMTLADFSQQLALLLRAGVGLADGLFLLAEEETDPDLRTLLSTLAQEVDQGAYLADALKQSGCFPTHMVGLLQVGEQVGRTEETLLALSRYYEDQAQMNRQLRHALTYPAILVMMMLVVIVVLLSQVLPVFEQVYASLGGSLTGLAGSLLSVGNLLRAILPYLAAVLGLILAAVAAFALVPSLRSRIIGWWQCHFGDRGISRKRNDARFAQALSMAFSSGMPLEEGITLAGELLKDCPAALQRSQDCRTRLDAGEDLTTALTASGMLPPASCRMLTLGLRAGTADATMEEIARRLSDDAREALESKVSMIEPALVLITSLLVGAILLAVMLPLMNIMKAIG